MFVSKSLFISPKLDSVECMQHLPRNIHLMCCSSGRRNLMKMNYPLDEAEEVFIASFLKICIPDLNSDESWNLV